MLPDFPLQKARLLKFWNNYLRQKEHEYLGYFANVPSYTHYEGDRWSIEGENGTIGEPGYRSVEAEFSVHIDEIPELTPDKIAQKLDSVAEKMARQMHDDILEGINQAVEKSGTGVDAKGRPLTKDLFLQVLDSMLLPFDKKGNLIPPAILMHPKMWEVYKDEMKAWEQDPEFNERFKEIVERKREVWRARESRRKLVD